jgi:hypothetical protein
LIPIGRTSGFAFDKDDNLLIGTFFRVKKLYLTKISQTIAFDALPAKTYGDAPFQLSATASSGLPVKFSNSNNSVATVSGSQVTIVGAGTSTISAYQAGDFINNEATTTQTLTVNKNSQVITFNTITDKTIGNPSFDLAATASSGLTISYATTSTNVTINSKAVLLNKPGRVTITASQAGNENYNAATPVARSFCVNPAKPNVTSTEGFPIILTSSNVDGNQWYKNGQLIAGATSNTLEVVDTGEYTVTTSSDGCSSLTSGAVSLIIAGTEEASFQNIGTYPNPVTDLVMVNIPDTINAKVAMFDLSGKRMNCKKEIFADAISINMSEVDSGMYVLQIQSGQGITVLKVIKR